VETTVTTEQNTLQEALQKYFGFDSFKGDQEEIMRSVLDGNHTFVIMPTGGGKSLCYQLPALVSEGTAVVVSPLIALMKNQVDAIRSLGNDNSIAHFLNSSLSKRQTEKVKTDVVDGRTKLLYVAPESLTKQETIDFLAGIDVSFFAIDEAHCISEWGHDFRPEYRRLRPMFDRIGETPIITLTATATPKVQADIQKNLGMQEANVFKASFNRPNLFYEVRPKRNVNKELIKFVKRNEGKSGIIYCLSRKKVEEIAELLQVNGFNALPYHAGMDAPQRADHQDRFLMEEVDVIVATIAFGMGIDKPDVRFVVHHDIPKSLESYYQETGRAGRDGGEGHCLAFYSYRDIEKLEKFLQGKPLAEQEVGKQLLMETVSYAETSLCRRKYLLHYFGESFDHEDCGGMCDNCRNPKEQFEGKDAIRTALRTIRDTKERHKTGTITDVLIGKASNEIRTYGLDRSPYFGTGKEQDQRFWNAIIRQSMVGGLIRKEIESYGILKVTEQGAAFIDEPYPFTITKEHDYSEEGDEQEAIEQENKGKAIDQQLYGMLKNLRKEMAQERGLPPFVIFQDPSLEDMATQYPITIDELKNTVGVGSGKANRFGGPFIELIGNYVEEQGIERPQDFVMKSVVDRSGLKVHVIRNIDRKLPFKDIAAAKGIKEQEVVDTVEAIVASGTKLNIDYHIDSILDEENQEEIYDYFMEAETDSLEEAYSEFDGLYSEEELRLMRIKFMSEMAN
jgi:ATP-dependent DNA helicase RecQ